MLRCFPATPRGRLIGPTAPPGLSQLTLYTSNINSSSPSVAGSPRSPFFTTAMNDYSRLDPYSRSRYDNGIDAKIVVMGNTGPYISRPSLYVMCILISCPRPHLQASERPACSSDTPRTSTNPNSPHPPPAHSSSQRKLTSKV